MDIFRYSQGVSVLKSVTMSEDAADTIQEDMEEGERVINSTLLGTVVEEGTITPRYQKYDQVITLTNNEITNLIEQNKDIESTMKILQRNITEFLKQ